VATIALRGDLGNNAKPAELGFLGNALHDGLAESIVGVHDSEPFQGCPVNHRHHAGDFIAEARSKVVHAPLSGPKLIRAAPNAND
ncbi:hypothetical protein ABTK53_19655, partial [Acinetobacter baumannii]